MNRIDEIETLLDTNAGNFNEVHLPIDDVRALIEYVKAAESYLKAYFGDANEIEDDELQAARDRLGLK
jgi:hypothetical protein